MPPFATTPTIPKLSGHHGNHRRPAPKVKFSSTVTEYYSSDHQHQHQHHLHHHQTTPTTAMPLTEAPPPRQTTETSSHHHSSSQQGGKGHAPNNGENPAIRNSNEAPY